MHSTIASLYNIISDSQVLISLLKSTFQAWDHAVGVICVHEAGGQVIPLHIDINLCKF